MSLRPCALCRIPAARHWAEFCVPYWHSNFINSYYGQYGELGRLGFIIHFRLYSGGQQGMGIVSTDLEGRPVFDLVYYPIKMYQEHTSTDRSAPDALATVIKGWDNYGWVQAMGTVHGETGEEHVHLVNKKSQPVMVNLTLLGVGDVASAYMDSIIGGGGETDDNRRISSDRLPGGGWKWGCYERARN